MNTHELRIFAESDFYIKCFLDIGELSTSPTKIYKVLNEIYQEHYGPHDRIVFYTSYLLPDFFLKHLYQAFNFLDVSNFFCLIYGPAANGTKIVQACEKYSSDPVPFGFCAACLDSTQPIVDRFTLPDTICAVPWTNLEIKSNGDILPCCMMSDDYMIGNIKTDNLQTLFDGDDMKSLRDRLLRGEKPEACISCWKVEAQNLTSIRQHNVKRLKKDFVLHYLDRAQIATLDIKFNNTCNFKCRICNREGSSLIAQEDYKFRGVPLVVQDNWSESDGFIQQICDLLPQIRNIDMYGGEPFLIKKFKQVLELAGDQDHAKNIRLHYNSNGSIWPDQFIPYWKKFKQVDVHFSIDAIGPQFELERGGHWPDVENNILRLRDLELSNLSISVMPTISVINLYYIDRVYDWASKHGFSIFVNHARGPGIGLENLTKQAKNLIVEKYKNHPWTEIQNILSIINHLPDNDGAVFREKITYFDRVRNQNFSLTHPEIAKAMGLM